jgi:DNA-binding NarL/FixJ family response regulator
LPIRVFLLLENRLVRDALNRLLRRRPELLVVGSSRPEDCSAETLIDCQCDVLILDFLDSRWLPAGLGQRMTGRSAPRPLLICMDEDSEPFRTTARAGAIGYLLKNASTSDVVRAVRATFLGETVCRPKLYAGRDGSGIPWR